MIIDTHVHFGSSLNFNLKKENSFTGYGKI